MTMTILSEFILQFHVAFRLLPSIQPLLTFSQIILGNRPFARGTKPPYWRAKVALGQDKQKAYIILNGNFLCLSCPSATLALQYGGFVPRDWLAAKGLL